MEFLSPPINRWGLASTIQAYQLNFSSVVKHLTSLHSSQSPSSGAVVGSQPNVAFIGLSLCLTISIKQNGMLPSLDYPTISTKQGNAQGPGHHCHHPTELHLIATIPHFFDLETSLLLSMPLPFLLRARLPKTTSQTYPPSSPHSSRKSPYKQHSYFIQASVCLMLFTLGSSSSHFGRDVTGSLDACGRYVVPSGSNDFYCK